MPDITSTIHVFTESAPAFGGRGAVRRVYVTTPNTADTSDTFDIYLDNYGSGPFLGISGWQHTTENSVVVSQAPTTSVTGRVLTVTLGTATNNKNVYKILIGDGF